MSKLKESISFDALDGKRVTILCQNIEHIGDLMTLLTSQGFNPEVEHTPTKFFSRLSSNNPGLVMVSAEMEEKHGRVVAGYVQRKFKVPVIIFRETKNDLAKGSYGPEVQFVDSTNANKIFDEIGQFKEKYESRLKSVEELFSRSEASYKAEVDKFWLKAQAKISSVKRASSAKSVSTYVLSTYQPNASENGMCYAFVFSSDSDLEQRFLVVDQFIEDLKDVHQSAETGKVFHFDTLLSREVIRKMEANADRAMHGEVDSVSVNFYFFEAIPSQDFEVVSRGNQESIMVPLEDWWVDQALPVDAFYWMQQNQRMLLYVRKGEKLGSNSLQRFRDKGQDKLAIHADHGPAFKVYRGLANQIDENFTQTNEVDAEAEDEAA
jgi:hypothetical protein